jgi:hypothetical protein
MEFDPAADASIGLLSRCDPTVSKIQVWSPAGLSGYFDCADQRSVYLIPGLTPADGVLGKDRTCWQEDQATPMVYSKSIPTRRNPNGVFAV